MDEPIPSLPPVDGGPCAEVVESGERLVAVAEPASPGLLCRPQYAAQGIPGALDACYCRAAVLRLLLEVAGRLQALGLKMVIWDAWRPVAVQAAIYRAYRAELVRQFPDLAEAEIDRRVRIYVAAPSRQSLQPSPHLTGGAVDVTLAGSSGGELPMGTGFDDFTPLAATRYYEELLGERPLDDDEWDCARNRRLLYHLMTGAGFTNYAGEWWHYNYGNSSWARRTGQPCRYGPIEHV